MSRPSWETWRARFPEALARSMYSVEEAKMLYTSRIEADYSVHRLAKECGACRADMSLYLRGLRLPPFEVAQAIAERIGVRPGTVSKTQRRALVLARKSVALRRELPRWRKDSEGLPVPFWRAFDVWRLRQGMSRDEVMAPLGSTQSSLYNLARRGSYMVRAPKYDLVRATFPSFPAPQVSFWEFAPAGTAHLVPCWLSASRRLRLWLWRRAQRVNRHVLAAKAGVCYNVIWRAETGVRPLRPVVEHYVLGALGILPGDLSPDEVPAEVFLDVLADRQRLGLPLKPPEMPGNP